MIAFSSPFSFRSGRSTLAACVLLALLALPCASFGQQSQADAEKKQLSEKVRDGMAKYGPLQDEKKWPEAIALLTDLQKVAQPGSYDEFLLAYVKGQVFLTIDQTANAVAPLEEALRVSDQQGFFDEKDERKVLKYLSQIYYGEGSAKGVAPAKQAEFFVKATGYLKRLLDNERAGNALSTDDVVFYAYLLVQRAQANPDKPEPALLQEARKVTEEGLLLSITPRKEFYPLLVSVMLAQNDYASAADIIELMLKKDPNNKDNWTQLSMIYLNLGSDEKDKEKAFENSLKAIVTYERAQALGFLKTPKDNFQLVGTYANIGQIEHAAELLNAGLRSGAIESDKSKWMYLATWYQQLNQDQKAIDVLKEAAKHFPDTGEFEFMAANNYYSMEKYEDAIQQAKAGAVKGLGDKTWQAWSLVAYTAFELRKYDEALEAANKALSYPESKKDPQLPNVKEAIERAIKDRAAQLEALKARQQ